MGNRSEDRACRLSLKVPKIKDRVLQDFRPENHLFSLTALLIHVSE